MDSQKNSKERTSVKISTAPRSTKTWTHAEMSQLVHQVKSVSKAQRKPPPTRDELVDTYSEGQFRDASMLNFWMSVANHTSEHGPDECYREYRYIMDSGLTHFKAHPAHPTPNETSKQPANPAPQQQAGAAPPISAPRRRAAAGPAEIQRPASCP